MTASCTRLASIIYHAKERGMNRKSCYGLDKVKIISIHHNTLLRKLKPDKKVGLLFPGPVVFKVFRDIRQVLHQPGCSA